MADNRFLNFFDFSIRSKPVQELKDKYCNADSKFMDIDGLNVHYKDQGSGPVLLLMHGVVSSLFTWDGWYDELKDNFRIIRLDLPGFGITGPKKNEDYLAPATNIFLDKFLNKLNVEHCFVAGNSLGGFYGWNYTIHNPKRVDKLIILDTIAYNQSLPYIFILGNLPGAKFLIKHLVFPRFFIEDSLRRLYSDKSKITKLVADRYWELALREGNRGAIMQAFENIYKLSKSNTIAGEVKKINRPVLMVWGKQDVWSRYKETLKFWQADLPKAELILYDNAGHIPMEEIPELTAFDAFKFMAKPIEDRPQLEKFNLQEKFKKYEANYFAKNK